MKSPRTVFAILVTLGLFAPILRAQTESEKDPVIPKGSVPAGKTLFVEKGCYQCHAADGITLLESVLDEKLIITLGTRRHAAWKRDDFARAILNANHTVNPDYEKAMMALGANFKAVNSPMPGFNDILTVSDLIHLTTFLNSLNQ